MAAVRAWLTGHGMQPEFDIVADGSTPAGDPGAARARVEPLEAAGLTWWLETLWEMPHHSDERMAEVHERLVAGPPSPG